MGLDKRRALSNLLYFSSWELFELENSMSLSLDFINGAICMNVHRSFHSLQEWPTFGLEIGRNKSFSQNSVPTFMLVKNREMLWCYFICHSMFIYMRNVEIARGICELTLVPLSFPSTLSLPKAHILQPTPAFAFSWKTAVKSRVRFGLALLSYLKLCTKQILSKCLLSKTF